MVKKIDEKKRMTIEVGGKTYPLRFGMKFLKEINKDSEDGLMLALTGLLIEDPVEIFRLLKASTNTYSDLTDDTLDEYFEFEADIESLVTDFLQILQAMNTTRKTVKALLPSLRKIAEQEQRLMEIEMKRAEKLVTEEINKMEAEVSESTSTTST